MEIANKTIPKSHVSKNKLPKVDWFNDARKQAIEECEKKHNENFSTVLPLKIYLPYNLQLRAHFRVE